MGVPETDGYIAYWSESHVSEDFDIALRLQTKGNLVRMASYHGDGFKEGVSLTVYDEVARWVSTSKTRPWSKILPQIQAACQPCS